MDSQLNNEVKAKSWGEVLERTVHNPYVDVAIGVAVGAGVILSRGKLMGAAEKLFPKASKLLGESEQIGESSLGAGAVTTQPGTPFNPANYRWVPGSVSTGVGAESRILGNQNAAHFAHIDALKTPWPVGVGQSQVDAAAAFRLAKTSQNDIDILKLPPWQRDLRSLPTDTTRPGFGNEKTPPASEAIAHYRWIPPRAEVSPLSDGAEIKSVQKNFENDADYLWIPETSVAGEAMGLYRWTLPRPKVSPSSGGLK